jgi:glycosyltransferase involved in cell wall biosynthesis
MNQMGAASMSLGAMSRPATPAANAAQTQHKLSVVIPAYNEEDGIAEIVERVLKIEPELKKIGVDGLELIVVDDGSKDRTPEIVRSYPTVRLIQHKVNKNYGGALKTGFHHATGDLLAFLDADSTYPPEYFPQMCKAVLDGADMCVGSRMAGEKNDSPKIRQVGNFMFAKLVSLIGNTKVTDVASGQRVFRRDVLPALYPLPDGLNFTPAMSTRAIHENLKIAEVAVPHHERSGRSKLGVVRDGMRFLNAIVWTALTYNPARILGGIGLAGIALAVIVAAILVIERLSGVTQLGPWGVFGVFSGLTLGVAGVSVFTLGMMFNYLVSLFHKRAIRQGVFGKPIFKTPLDRQFWWMGGAMAVVGVILALVALALGLSSGGPAGSNRQWFWMLCSSMIFLVGVQLVVSWFVMRVLEELNQREGQVDADLAGKAVK